MAWQFHCDFYDPTLDIDTKISIVKQSIKIHQKKGTPQAVIDLLGAAFSSTTELYEWFQYDGKPYHFKIKTSSLNSVNMENFLKALNSVKNARSICDGIQLFEMIKNAVVSRGEVKSDISYSMIVADAEAYAFGDGSPFAFGTTEREYSFIER